MRISFYFLSFFDKTREREKERERERERERVFNIFSNILNLENINREIIPRAKMWNSFSQGIFTFLFIQQ